MIRHIELDNIKIEYDLQRKNVKNINLRVKSDGTVSVSANEKVPQQVIDEFVISKQDFILNALEKIKNASENPSKRYFTDTQLGQLIFALCEGIYPYFAEKGVKRPQIKFRKMVSRWGSCHTQNGILTFNTNLVYAPRDCVRYVVLHEFTHFLIPNHSSEFYSELEKVCPDWKECENKLKEVNIR